MVAKPPQKQVVNQLNTDTNSAQQLSVIEKLISLLDKSHARVEALELENKKLKEEITLLKMEK